VPSNDPTKPPIRWETTEAGQKAAADLAALDFRDPAIFVVERERLTIAEAVARFDVGAKTLRRWLQRGELPGAVKVPSMKGDTYRIPLAALKARGLRPRGGAEAASPEAAAALKRAETELRKARAQLEEAAAKTREAEAATQAAQIRASQLAAELDAERDKLRLVSEAQSDLRRALLILESEQQKRTRAEQEAARSFFGWLRHRKTAKQQPDTQQVPKGEEAEALKAEKQALVDARIAEIAAILEALAERTGRGKVSDLKDAHWYAGGYPPGTRADTEEG
jgi:hypothetical protein